MEKRHCRARLCVHRFGLPGNRYLRRLKLGDTYPHNIKSWYNLIELYEDRGKPEKAEECRAKLPKTETTE